MSRLGAASLMAVLLGGASPATDDPAQTRLRPFGREGPPTSLSAAAGGAAILLFWRSDCIPCRFELTHLAEYRRAGGTMPVLTINLEPEGPSRHGVGPLPRSRRDWVALDDPGLILQRFGGVPPRLPLSTAIDDDGRICGAHRGVLGLQTIARYGRDCRK